jgi:predicted aspartyl protease
VSKKLMILALAASSIGCADPKLRAESPVIADVEMGQPLTVVVNGEGPFRFGIDTGQSVSLLVSPKLAARLTLPVLPRIEASDGVSSKSVEVVRVNAAELGTMELNNQLGLVMAPTDESLDGALGMPFFDGVLVEFDGPAHRLRIQHGSLPAPDGRTVLPVRLDRGLPVVSITIGGRDTEALLDTGSAGGLLIPMSMRDQLPLASAPVKSGRVSTLTGEFDISSAQLRGAVTIGGFEINDPKLSFSDYFSEVNLGRDFLRDFIVTFDVGNARVRFEREKMAPNRPKPAEREVEVGTSAPPQ